MSQAFSDFYTELSGLERNLSNAAAAFDSAEQAVQAQEAPRRTSGSTTELLADVDATRAELDAAQRDAQSASAVLVAAEKDLLRARDTTAAKLYQRLQRLEALQRPELSEQLGKLRDAHEATLRRIGELDSQRRDVKDDESRYRTADAAAREAAAQAERALRRVQQAEEDAERQRRQEDDVFGQASGEARALGKHMQRINAELPRAEQRVQELSEAHTAMIERLRALDVDPDERLPLDRQLADAGEERPAQLNEVKRTLGAELAKQLSACEREAGVIATMVAQAQKDFGKLASQVSDLFFF